MSGSSKSLTDSSYSSSLCKSKTRVTAAGEMDPSPPSKELSLQGPRPSALKIRDDSHKIKKPLPPHKPPQHHHNQMPEAGAGYDDNNRNQRRKPVIIYSVSPKVIYANESEFRSVVQRLTGPSSSSTSASTSAVGAEFHSSFQSSGNISPAARFATVEKATRSPREADRDRGGVGRGGLERSVELMSDVMAEGVEMSQIPGILSPAPAKLPQISPNFFLSSAIESPSQWGALGHDFSPNNFRHGFSNPSVGFATPSPSGLFSGPIMSPTLSYDLFNHFMDQ